MQYSNTVMKVETANTSVRDDQITNIAPSDETNAMWLLCFK